MTLVSSLQTLSEQINAHNWSEDFPKPKSAFSVRAERNHIFRWSLTVILSIAYVLRVIYVPGYFLLTIFLALYLVALVHGYSDSEPDLLRASDYYFLPYGNGQRKPALVVYFSQELSTPQIHALVLHLHEFKFWYTVTKAMLIALLLTWFTLIRFPSLERPITSEMRLPPWVGWLTCSRS